MENVSKCHELNEPWILAEFYLVVLFGTSVAVISTFENVILFYMFASRRHFRTSNLFYMTFIAFFDIFIGVSFILLLSVKVLHDYLPSVMLHRLWHLYFREVFTVCHVSLAASTFLIISATLERFLAIRNPALFRLAEKYRLLIAAFSIFLGVLLKGTIYFEFTIHVNKNCSNRARYRAMPSEQNWYYSTIWQFYARHIFLVFLPFFVLMYMNVKIVISLRKRASDSVENVRTATRMLVLIVTIYLISNVLNLVITAWEHVNSDSLDSEQFTEFHVYSADTTTILTVAAGASRLPIYLWLNRQIRNELKVMLCCCIYGDTHRRHDHSESSRYKYGAPCNTPETRILAEECSKFLQHSVSDSMVALVDNGVKSELVNDVWNKQYSIDYEMEQYNLNVISMQRNHSETRTKLVKI